MTTTFAKIVLPSGNLAVYEIQSRYAGKPEEIRMLGSQVAVLLGGVWTRLGRPIEDAKLIKLLNVLTITTEGA